ncbi:hypothetical protein ACH5RR_023926 [Cinchona calisaya]|uniref:LOB domain-containing protein n=1 Tax=Cinchona calisaya TaxID=153742 RepID=A0ABD2ZD51_9GENT
MNGDQNYNGNGPCGACKFLRRKCIKGCIFAPYFDQEQGTAHFAAVHKVFGASNASKMLQRVPAHKRIDAVVTLCYEALARIRDPVYGCAGHLFTLQNQVVNLQAELACAQARLSTLQGQPPTTLSPSQTSIQPSSSTSAYPLPSSQSQQTSILEMANCFSNSANDHRQDDFENAGDDLHALTHQGFVSRYYFPGVKFKPPSTNYAP